MAGLAAYVVAFSAMLFAVGSALALFHTVGQLDSPEMRRLAERMD